MGQRNHRLFILLLVTFVSAEMCYFLCLISCFPNFINFWKRETQVNWEKYPEFQQEIPPEPGRPFPGRKFKNPYNKDILLNIIGFLKSKV